MTLGKLILFIHRPTRKTSESISETSGFSESICNTEDVDNWRSSSFSKDSIETESNSGSMTPSGNYRRKNSYFELNYFYSRY